MRAIDDGGGLLWLQMPRSHVTTKFVQISIFTASVAAASTLKKTSFNSLRGTRTVAPTNAFTKAISVSVSRSRARSRFLFWQLIS